MFARPGPLGMRTVVLAASVGVLGVAALILWLGLSNNRETARLASEGAMVQGEYFDTIYASGDDSSDTTRVSYRVGGKTYLASMTSTRSGASPPLLKEAVIDVPRLGPKAPLQVVYLPADPAVSRLREDLKDGSLVVYLGAGFFAFIGVIFAAAGIFLLPRNGESWP